MAAFLDERKVTAICFHGKIFLKKNGGKGLNLYKVSIII